MKKGFTLVEMLGVIIVISIIGAITIPIVSGVLKKNVDSLNSGQEKLIVNAAKSYVNFHATKNFTDQKISVSILQTEGFLESDCIKKADDGEGECSYNNSCVLVTKTGSKYKFTFKEKNC